MIEYLKLAAAALALTVAVEGLFALIFGLRSRNQLLAILVINVITNPALNFLVALNNYLGFINQNLILLLCLEVIVVFIEWKLLVYALQLKTGRAFLFSVILNTASFLAGLLIFW